MDDYENYGPFATAFAEPQRIRLDKMKIGMQLAISSHLIDSDVRFNFDDFFQERVTAQLTGFLYSRDAENLHVEYPADWWQAFKERWFPARALERWPVVYCVVSYNIKAVYPELQNRMSIPNAGNVVFLATNERYKKNATSN